MDWENGVTPQKPGGRLNELLDKWIEYLRGVDGAAAEAPKRRVSAVPPAPVERMGVRLGTPVHPQALQSAPPPPPIANIGQGDGHGGQGNGDIGQGCGDIQGGAVVVNGQRPAKRRRTETPVQMQELRPVVQEPPHIEPPREQVKRVVVEGALTKEDWRDIMGNDARLRALENKVDKIEVLASQNNKLLLQLLQNSRKSSDDERRTATVHLDPEFERDYL